MKRILVVHSAFSSAHFYKNDSFTETENRKHFGRCYTSYGHGHNYQIEVGFLIKSKIKNQTLQALKIQLDKKITKLTYKLDHEHLNFVIPEFKKVIPTTENILLYFEKKISALDLKNQLAFIKLFEMENLWSEKHYVTYK